MPLSIATIVYEYARYIVNTSDAGENLASKPDKILKFFLKLSLLMVSIYSYSNVSANSKKSEDDFSKRLIDIALNKK